MREFLQGSTATSVTVLRYVSHMHKLPGTTCLFMRSLCLIWLIAEDICFAEW